MKVFEFHFNPKWKKKDVIFDSFCFVPETKGEENLGYLYLVGELKNVLPKTENLLTEVAEIIKREYYKFPEKVAGDSFKESLAKANEFLAQKVKKENVSWLGNLNFAAISLTKDFLINLSKVGNLKILLLRDEEVFNIGENVNFASSPTKTFPNIVEGKLSQGDKLLILTQETFETFDKERIIQNLARVKKPKEIKRIFKEKKKILREIFGVCLLIILKKKGILAKKIYSPKIHYPAFAKRIPQKILPQSPLLQVKLKKSLLYLLILAILLLLGYLIFK